MSNFSYLSTRPEYSLFANSAIEAEKVFSTSPAMCAVGCRKALELAVKCIFKSYLWKGSSQCSPLLSRKRSWYV